MPLYAKVDYGSGPSWEGYTPTLGESAGAAWSEAWAGNPVPSVYNYIRMHTATEGIQLVRDVEMPDGSVVEFDEPAPDKQPRRLSLEEQETRIRDAGLQGFLKAQEGYTPEALDILIPLKKAELSRQFVSSRTPASHMPFTFAAGLAASALDPINVASAFVPVVGEARVLSMLGRAKGTLGRAAVRAEVGLVEGAVGGALVEPLVHAGQKAVQADYDMTDSLLNVGFGAIMGAGLQPLAGGVGDFLRRRRGIVQPWAMADRTDVSESLRLDMAGRMEMAFLEANPEADAGEVRRNALASAALFDARARSWAYDTGKNAEDYYTRYGVEFRAGNAAGEAGTDTLEQAMYPAREMDIPAFVARVSQEGQTAQKSYFSWKGQDDFEGWEIRLPSDTVFHQKKRHPDMTDADNARLPHVLRSLEDVEPSARGKGIYGPAFLARAHADGQGYGIAFEVNHKGQLFVTTFFRDSDRALEAWLEREKKKAPRVPAASETESALSPGVGSGGPVREKLQALLAVVKSSGVGGDTLFQNVSRARVDFGADGKAVIEFFNSSDFTSAPHELYHIFRRELAETATAPDASPRTREQWAKIEEFVGAKPGRTWARDMEEKFARAGERFLLEGKAPSPSLSDVFARLRQWFMELYADADAAGLEISPAMREVFNSMFSVPADQADASFRHAVGDLAAREPERGYDNAGENGSDAFVPGGQGEDVETVGALIRDAETGLDETLNIAVQSEPKAAELAVEDFTPELAAADADIMRARLARDVMRQAAACETGR